MMVRKFKFMFFPQAEMWHHSFAIFKFFLALMDSNQIAAIGVRCARYELSHSQSNVLHP
jgi:hypothetical protein